MKRITKELTQEQYLQLTETGDLSNILSPQELCGYGVYNVSSYKDSKSGRYYMTFDLGSSCD